MPHPAVLAQYSLIEKRMVLRSGWFREADCLRLSYSGTSWVPLSVQSILHHFVRPQTSTAPAWETSCYSPHGFIIYPKGGIDFSCLQLLHSLQIWQRSCQCWSIQPSSIARYSSRCTSDRWQYVALQVSPRQFPLSCRHQERDWPLLDSIQGSILPPTPMAVIWLRGERWVPTICSQEGWAQHRQWLHTVGK